MTNDQSWLATERHDAQLGPLHAILRTRGQFVIRATTAESFEVALQTSRNLFQYFAADSEIVDLDTDVTRQKGSVISVALNLDFPRSASQFHSIELKEARGLVVRRHNGLERIYHLQEGLGAIFLRPLPFGRLELVIWGYDSWGLRLAGRLMPMLTGVGQPDFIVVSKECAWKGAAGVLAMGSFDNIWTISEASFIS